MSDCANHMKCVVESADFNFIQNERFFSISVDLNAEKAFLCQHLDTLVSVCAFIFICISRSFDW